MSRASGALPRTVGTVVRVEWIVWVGLLFVFLLLTRLIARGRSAREEVEELYRDSPAALAEFQANAERSRNIPPQ